MSAPYSSKAWEELLPLTIEAAAKELEGRLSAAFQAANVDDACKLSEQEGVGIDMLRHWLLSRVANLASSSSKTQDSGGSRMDTLRNWFGSLVANVAPSSGRVQDKGGLCFICTTPLLLWACPTSGGCADWAAAVNILGQILEAHPELVVAPCACQQKLALATALCFADTSAMDVNMHDKPVDPVQRFEHFSTLCAVVEEPPLVGNPNSSLNVWHWRYVVGSWHSDEDLSWALSAVKEDLRDPNKIGQAARMISYKDRNPEGVSVQEGLKFYGNKKSTMPVIFAEGGVCGAISKFGTSACQAFGVPAMPVAQPGHCALIWRNNSTGEWQFENSNAGWSHSNMHAFIQRTWPELRWDGAGIIPIMECAQAAGEKYSSSELLRLTCDFMHDKHDVLALLARAIDACPYNMLAWSDFLRCMDITQPDVALATLHALRQQKQEQGGAVDFALLQPVQASADWHHAPRVVDGTDSEWFPASSHRQWLEVDLLTACEVEEVRVKWWGDYGKKTKLSLLSRATCDEAYETRSELPPSKESKLNSWSSMPGWPGKTKHVRLELSNPAFDCFNLKKKYGVRRLVVLGRRCDDELVSLEEVAAHLFPSPSVADVQMRRYLVRVSPPTKTLKAASVLRPMRPRQLAGVEQSSWLTLGAPSLAKSSGCYYHEVRLGEHVADPQIGWATSNFAEEDTISGNGVGDDTNSFAVDGMRHLCWQGGENSQVQWPSTWKEGDVVGCAIDVDAGVMTFSLNGEWFSDAMMAFDAEELKCSLYPALSLKGNFGLLLPKRAWLYDPPSAEFQAWAGPEAARAVYHSPLF